MLDVMPSPIKSLLYINIILILFQYTSGFNAPPYLSSSKHWTVYEDYEIGTIVTTLKARDAENDPVKFTLEAHWRFPDIYTYFKIDEIQRVVVAKPLAGKAGEYIVRVRKDDGGEITTVTEIRLEILKSPASGNTPNESPKSPSPGFFNTPFPSIDISNGELPVNGLEYFPNPSQSVTGIRMDTYAWRVYSDVPVGTVIQEIEVLDSFGANYQLSLLNSDGLLSLDKSGQVRVNIPLFNKVGLWDMKVLLTSGTKIDEKDITLEVVRRLSHPPSFPTSPITDPVILQNPSPLPYPSQRPNSKVSDGEGNNSQNLRVFKNTPSGSYNTNSVVSSTEEPQEAPKSGVSLTVIPIVLFAGISPLVLALYCYWRRLQRRKARAEAKESVVVYTEKAEEVIAAQVPPRWGTAAVNNEPNRNRFRRGLSALFLQRATSNMYEEPIDSNQGKKKRKASEVAAPTADSWEFPRHHLKFLGILGEGCFGQVWKCEARGLNPKGSMLVAVKTLKESAGERERKDLDQELKVLKNLGKHINVVSILGCCTEKDPIFIILEYMIGGKLQSYLRASRADTCYNNLHAESSSLTPRDLTRFTYQIARGMEFLARNGIIHRDLAARNVLVGEEKICKVADFGFARDVANNRIYERKSDGRLPIRWMAPESLFDNIFTTKSDVWSFGVLLWEIVTLGSTPYAGFGAAEVMKKVKEGYRLEKPDHCRREIYNIMYYCWDKNPNERPSFTELVHTLENLILTEVDYIELDRFPDHSYYNVISEKTDELL